MTWMTDELCACGCGRPKGPKHRGWSVACYTRWYRAGAREGEQPPPPRNGPEYSATLREELVWLVEGGTSTAEAAAHVSVTLQTAKSYLAPPKPRAPRAECAHLGCAATASYRRWCAAHKDLRRLYQDLRAGGLGRHAAAHRLGVSWRSTYAWEPARNGLGRPARPAPTPPAADTDTPKPASRPRGRPPQPRTTVTTKRCARCQTVKPAEEFTPDRRAPDGLYASCRSCCNWRRRANTKAAAA
jgi:transposase